MIRIPRSNVSHSLRGKQISRLYSQKSPVPPTNPTKPTTPTPTPTPTPQPKKSRFPFFSFTLLTTTAGLGYLAYKVEQRDHAALLIADQPGFEALLQPFHTAIDFVDKYYPLKPAKKTLSPPTSTPTEVENNEPEMPEEPTPEASPVAEEIHVPEESVFAVVDETIAAAEPVVELEIVTPEEVIAEEPAPTPAEEQTHTHHHEEATPAPVAPVTLPPPVVVAEVIVPVVVPHAQTIQSTTAQDILVNTAKHSLALRQELESALLKDLHSLDASALRLRVSQLTSELFERMSWENMRLTSAVQQLESELHEKYTTLLKKQKEELGYELERVLFEREKAVASESASRVAEIEAKYQAELHATIKAQAEGFQATLQRELTNQAGKITTELQDQLNHALALVQQQHSSVLLELQPKIASLYGSLCAYATVIDRTQQQQVAAQRHEQFSTAVMTLDFLLNSAVAAAGSAAGQQVQHKVHQLLGEIHTLSEAEAGEGFALVASVLNTLPSRLRTTGETVSLSDVQVRFAVMRQEVRKVALAPKEVPTMVGQLIGSFLATIALTPKGYITGAGTEEALARAAYYIERGNVPLGLKELGSIEGYEQTLMHDWKALAEEYLLVQQGVKILKTEALIRHEVGCGLAQ